MGKFPYTTAFILIVVAVFCYAVLIKALILNG